MEWPSNCTAHRWDCRTQTCFSSTAVCHKAPFLEHSSSWSIPRIYQRWWNVTPSNIISTPMTLSSRTIHRSHHRCLNLEYGTLHRCCTYLVFIEASSKWIQRRPRSSGSGPVPAWNVYSTHASVYMFAHLQRVPSAAVRLMCGLGQRDHVSKSLCELHWLPIRFRIVCKLWLMMYNVHIECSLGYIKEILTSTAGLPNRSSSASTNYELPALHHKIGERAFSYAGPASWNSLPNERVSRHIFLNSLLTFDSVMHLWSQSGDDSFIVILVQAAPYKYVALLLCCRTLLMMLCWDFFWRHLSWVWTESLVEIEINFAALRLVPLTVDYYC